MCYECERRFIPFPFYLLYIVTSPISIFVKVRVLRTGWVMTSTRRSYSNERLVEFHLPSASCCLNLLRMATLTSPSMLICDRNDIDSVLRWFTTHMPLTAGRKAVPRIGGWPSLSFCIQVTTTSQFMPRLFIQGTSASTISSPVYNNHSSMLICWPLRPHGRTQPFAKVALVCFSRLTLPKKNFRQ